MASRFPPSPTVLITASLLKNLEGPHLGVLRDAGCTVRTPPPPWDNTLSKDQLLTLLDGVDATIASMEPYTADVFDRSPKLRVVARAGVGYDAVEIPAATARGVAVTITPGANHECVAEHAFGLLLALVKNIVSGHNTTVAGQWQRGLTQPLRGQTLGLIGFGRIGKAMVTRAAAFRMKVIAFDTMPDREIAREHDVELLPMIEVIRRADVISLHAPATPETHHLINRSTLAEMRPNAILLNTSRGGLIHESDLVEALRGGRLGGAVLDVFSREPPPKDHPLFTLPNVVVTPHTAGTDTQSVRDMAEMAARGIVALARGEWPGEMLVNPEVKPYFVTL